MLRRQLDRLDGKVRAGEARVVQSRSQAGVVEPSASGTITDQQVGQLVKAGAQPTAKEAPLANARWQIARFKIDSVPRALNSPLATFDVSTLQSTGMKTQSSPLASEFQFHWRILNV